VVEHSAVVWSMLPMAAWWWWRTVVRGETPPVTGLEAEGVRWLHHTVELLLEEEGDEELTGDGEFGDEGVGQHSSQRMEKSVIPES
jgi:hypothetical protein